MLAAASPTRLLLAAACNWESSIPLAISLRDAGFEVAIVAPRDHPLHAVSGIASRWRYLPLLPMTSLHRAIKAVRPAVIMPCDESMMTLLQQLRDERTLAPSICGAIESALGPKEAAPILTSRTGLAKIAEQTGVRIPPSAEISSASQLLAWLRRHGPPAYLKIDHSTGGRGVVRIDSLRGGLIAYWRLRLFFGVPRSLWLWLRWGDLSSLPLLRAGGAAAITVQKAIDGLPANCAFAAWRGKLLACIAVEALETRTPTGVATVVRVSDAPAMADIARKVVARLGLSGLHGLDFILARDTGLPWLIEINGRPTQTAYLRLGAGADLAGAFYATATGLPEQMAGVFRPGQVIRLFEQPSDAPAPLPDLTAAAGNQVPPLPAIDLGSPANSAIVST